jgi:ABC-type uncharacterized transport system substrate-binding protein
VAPFNSPGVPQTYAAELVQLKPDVIIANSSLGVSALLRETRTIPVVFMAVPDPVGQGFVESLARPGGNATGFSLIDFPMVAKQGAFAETLTRCIHVQISLTWADGEQEILNFGKAWKPP